MKFLLFGAVSLLLASCLKEGAMNINPNASNNVLELNNTGDNIAPSGIPGYYSDLGSIAAGGSKTFNLNIQYSGPGVAPQDITVTLATDQATLDSYNAANGTSKIIPPTSAVSFPTSAVILKGTSQVTVLAKVTVSPDFNFNAAYGVPVKITASSPAITIGSFGASVYSFGVRNGFDGAYTITGTLVDAASSGIHGNYPLSCGLVTSGANTVRLFDNVIGGVYHSILSGASLSYYGAFGLEFTIDASNKITKVVNVYGQPASNGRSASLDPSGVNTWDPSTKTMKVKYWMDQPSVIAGHRVAFDETFTYNGVR